MTSSVPVSQTVLQSQIEKAQNECNVLKYSNTLNAQINTLCLRLGSNDYKNEETKRLEDRIQTAFRSLTSDENELKKLSLYKERLMLIAQAKLLFQPSSAQ